MLVLSREDLIALLVVTPEEGALHHALRRRLDEIDHPESTYAGFDNRL